MKKQLMFNLMFSRNFTLYLTSEILINVPNNYFIYFVIFSMNNKLICLLCIVKFGFNLHADMNIKSMK